MKPTILRTRRKNHIETLEARIAPATFTVINLDDSGAGSLRDAVTKANLTPAADTIVFKAGLAGAIILTGGEMDITAPLSIKGPGATKLTISGNASSRIFEITDGDNTKETPVSISGVALVNGKATGGSGGAIFSTESLSIINCTLAFNTANSGGAIHLQGGLETKASVSGSLITGNSATSGYAGALYLDAVNGVSITKTIVTGNTATSGGGAAYLGIDDNTDPKVKISVTGSVFAGNTSGGGGGAINFSGDEGQIIVTGSTFTGNKAASRGGALYGYYAKTMTVTGSLFSQNESGGPGGAIDFYGMKNVVKGSKFIGNTAGGGGGAIRFNGLGTADSALEVSASTFSGNSGTDGGGVFANAGGTVKLTASIFTANRASGAGGAVATNGDAANATKLTVVGGTFSDNSGDSGGAIDTNGDGAVAISAAKFLRNRTISQDGGGLYLRSTTTISVVGSLISENFAFDDGGGIVTGGSGVATLSGLSVFNNFAGDEGGGIAIFAGTAAISKSLIRGNHAGQGGGLDLYGTVSIQTTIITGNTAKVSHGGVYKDTPGTVTVAATVKIFGNLAPATPDSN